MTNIHFSNTNRNILESYKGTIEGLATYLGPAYELVLHSLEDLEHSVILIINGHHTGRTVGSPITDLALSMLKKIQEHNTESEMSTTYFVENSHGDPMRSTTIAIRGENERIIAVLCINFYLNTPLSTILDYNTPKGGILSTSHKTEQFVDNSEALIRNSIKIIQKRIYADDSISSSNKNREIILALNKDGLFNLKNAVNIVSKLLCITKNTVYMHLRNNVSE